MPEQTFNAVSLVVAIVAALVSIFFSERARRESTIQRRMQILSLQREHHSALRSWANEVVDTMIEASFLVNVPGMPKDEFDTRRHAIQARLSALTDRGRWFLPNERQNEHGLDRPLAFRGIRPPELSFVIDAYNLLKEMGDDSYEENLARRQRLWAKRKEFVSALQSILDPRERERELRELSVIRRAPRTVATRHHQRQG